MTTFCRRCGASLLFTLEGIPTCFDCHRREHIQIEVFTKDGQRQASAVHKHLLAVLESQEPQTRI